jgi:CBS domain-containing protein
MTIALAGQACVREAMISRPKLCSAHVTVAQVRRLFDDRHVHAALVVDHDGILLTVVERADLLSARLDDELAARFGCLDGRTATADLPLARIQISMLAAGRRRLAVVDSTARVLGLLCLKASGAGFCSEQDVHARALERAATDRPAGTTGS